MYDINDVLQETMNKNIVYVIKYGTIAKIGTSVNLVSRLAGVAKDIYMRNSLLKTDYVKETDRLELIAYIFGGLQLEKYLHLILSEHQVIDGGSIGREWFHLNSETQDYIAILQNSQRLGLEGLDVIYQIQSHWESNTGSYKI